MSKKPENKNAIDAVAFRADTLGIYGRHLLLPNPKYRTTEQARGGKDYRKCHHCFMLVFAVGVETSSSNLLQLLFMTIMRGYNNSGAGSIRAAVAIPYNMALTLALVTVTSVVVVSQNTKYHLRNLLEFLEKLCG